MPRRWRDYVHANRRSSFRIIPTPLTANALIGNRGRRRDAYVDGDPAPPGWSYEMLRDQLLDPHDYYRALLTHDLGEMSCFGNPYYGVAVAQAVNDWSSERWLDLDDRLYSVCVIPTAQPDEAAKEIRRVGAHPKIVGVLLAGNPFGRPFGDPVYHPIYEAAAEMGLAISIHVATADKPDGEVTSVGGPLASAPEYYATFAQAAMHYVTSFITHGVFEKFPSLHVMVKEYGVAWVPYLIWRLDAVYEQLKLESSWVKRLPSEYIREHMRFSTQPIEDSPNRGGTAQVLGTVPWLEEILCFSTDYPHYSFDKPSYVGRLAAGGLGAQGVLRQRLRDLRLGAAAGRGRLVPGPDPGMSRRHVIGTVTDFPPRRPVPVRVSGRELVVVRWDEELFAVRNTCPHQSQAFTPDAHVRGGLEATGRVGELGLGEQDPVIVCPWHTWEFRLRDGRCARDASMRVKTYRIDIEGDDVVLEL